MISTRTINGTRRVCKLKKALYGVKQAAREWHKTLTQLLSELGFDRCHSDPALFVCEQGGTSLHISKG